MERLLIFPKFLLYVSTFSLRYLLGKTLLSWPNLGLAT